MADWRQNLLEEDERILDLMRGTGRIAVLGIKTERQEHKPAFTVPRYLQQEGYEIVPVPVYYPEVSEILGQPVYRRVPGSIDMVDVFRLPWHIAARAGFDRQAATLGLVPAGDQERRGGARAGTGRHPGRTGSLHGHRAFAAARAPVRLIPVRPSPEVASGDGRAPFLVASPAFSRRCPRARHGPARAPASPSPASPW